MPECFQEVWIGILKNGFENTEKRFLILDMDLNWSYFRFILTFSTTSEENVWLWFIEGRTQGASHFEQSFQSWAAYFLGYLNEVNWFISLLR